MNFSAPALRRLSVLALLPAALCAHGAQARSFQAEGADTGAGLGARQVAQGGTGVATSDDLYALFYNPAGLAAVPGLALSVSRQLNARLHDVNFLGAAWRLPIDAQRWGLNVTVAAAFYPRIHARAQGAFGEGDFESLFLRYLLPGVSGTFDGDIDSKTKTYRAALGLAPAGDSPWSFGAYVDRIDCQSNFCGVHATSNGFTTQSTGAKALGFGAGLRYRWSPQLTLAASVSDLRTRLTVDSVTTDNAGTRRKQTDAEFPRKLALGLGWQPRADTTAALDYEVTKGRYGSSQIDLQVLRLGAEHRRGPWAWRAGAVVPVKIFSTLSGDLRAPFPLGPTLGLGWQTGAGTGASQGRLKLDLAVYAHAVMSMHKDKASPAAELSASFEF